MLRRSFLAAAPLYLSACRATLDLPDMGKVPAFTLAQAGGGVFDSTRLKGKIWVGSYMFTHCPGPCPRMNSRLKKWMDETPQFPQVQFVSFSVDAKRDTPEVLAKYADAMHADRSRWHFLTADGTVPEQAKTMQHLARNVFKVGDIDGSLLHTTRLQLVDPTGIYRGSYGAMVSIPGEPDGLDAMTGDIEKLVRFFGNGNS